MGSLSFSFGKLLRITQAVDPKTGLYLACMRIDHQYASNSYHEMSCADHLCFWGKHNIWEKKTTRLTPYDSGRNPTRSTPLIEIHSIDVGSLTVNLSF